MGNGFYPLTGAADQRASEFLIRHEKVDLHICLSSLNKLRLHEETIPSRVAELKDDILRKRLVKDPIIVDADSCVVLDGMHRVAALRELKSICLPVCAVDYLNPSIKVGVWYRALSGRFDPDQVKTALSTARVKFERFSFDMAKSAENVPLAMLFANGECLELKGDGAQVYETLKIAEQCVRQIGLAVRFETERDALENLLNRKAEAILTLPKIDKLSVREAGLTGRLLPHKVTRHIIPARPLGVNAPLSTLMDRVTPVEEINRRFVVDLQSRGTTRRPSETIIDGRRYEEETFIFNQ